MRVSLSGVTLSGSWTPAKGDDADGSGVKAGKERIRRVWKCLRRSAKPLRTGYTYMVQGTREAKDGEHTVSRACRKRGNVDDSRAHVPP